MITLNTHQNIQISRSNNTITSLLEIVTEFLYRECPAVKMKKISNLANYIAILLLEKLGCYAPTQKQIDTLEYLILYIIKQKYIRGKS